MASKLAKRAAMRTKYTAPISRSTLTYAAQTMKNWMGQIDPLTQASMGVMTQQASSSPFILLDYDAPATFTPVGGGGVGLGGGGLVANDAAAVPPSGGGAEQGPVLGGGVVGGGGGTGTGTETVSQCHTHTMTDWTGYGEQYLNGQTSPAIGTDDGHTHLVVAGNVQPVSAFLFPDVEPHTHISLTEI